MADLYTLRDYLKNCLDKQMIIQPCDYYESFYANEYTVLEAYKYLKQYEFNKHIIYTVWFAVRILATADHMDISEVFKLFEQNAMTFTKCIEDNNCNVLDGIFSVYHTMHDIMTNYFNCVIMEDDIPSFGIYDWEEGIIMDID